MRLVLTSSEAVPYSKTGGLADVSSALAKALAAAGHEVTLILPHYPQVQKKNRRPPASLDGPRFPVPLGDATVEAASGWDVLDAGRTADGRAAEVRVRFVSRAAYFDRPGLYGDPAGDYTDNAERFIFFSRAALELTRLLALRPHAVHAHDWQTGLIPAMLAEDYRGTPGFERTGGVFTIHNLAFQGSFPHWDMRRTGLDWALFNFTQLEHHGGLSLLKAGIAFADKVTTVSPTYAEEIRTAAGGYGLEGALNARGTDLVGVLNGVDAADWNPAADPHLAANYTAAAWREGKAKCKAALRKELKLEARPRPAVRDDFSRMTDQKGFDLIAGCAEELIATGGAVRVPRDRRSPLRGVRAAPGEPPPRAGRGGDRVRQRPGPPHRGRRRRLPHAQPVRALRAQSDVFAGLRDGPGRARGRRAGGHRRGRLPGEPQGRHGQRVRVRPAHPAGPVGGGQPGRGVLPGRAARPGRGWSRPAWPPITVGTPPPRSTSSCIRPPPPATPRPDDVPARPDGVPAGSPRDPFPLSRTYGEPPMTAPAHLAFLWHQHQPYYPDDVARENPMPWVRLHSTKDYLGMALHIKEVPEFRCAINLVPSLLVQINQYVEGRSDRHLDVSRAPADGLSERDAEYLMNNFFMANAETMIRPHARYHELHDLRGFGSSSAAEAARRFSARDVRDLQVWSNLTWVHELVFERDADLREFREKGPPLDRVGEGLVPGAPAGTGRGGHPDS